MSPISRIWAYFWELSLGAHINLSSVVFEKLSVSYYHGRWKKRQNFFRLGRLVCMWVKLRMAWRAEASWGSKGRWPKWLGYLLDNGNFDQEWRPAFGKGDCKRLSSRFRIWSVCEFIRICQEDLPELEGDWTFVEPGMQCWVVAVVEVGCRSV